MESIEILGNKDTRSGFGEGLAELGAENENVVALCADPVSYTHLTLPTTSSV